MSKKFALGLFIVLVNGCSGETKGATSGGNTTGGQACTHTFSCSGSACQCSEGPKKGMECCDPMDPTCTVDKCDAYCLVCD